MRRERGDWRLAALAALAAVLVAGCASWPRIDPSNQGFFLPPEAPPAPAAPGAVPPPSGTAIAPQVATGLPPWEPAELILNPPVTVAPIGGEVVLVASVRGADQFLRTNERVDWQIAPGSVGQFLDFNPPQCLDLLFDLTWPRKISPTLVVTSTSRREMRLTRGTANPYDDVTIAAGQTWVSVTSPVEGTTYVTAVAPGVANWERRGQTAVIHWVDAQWQFPPPAINPAGTRHVFTTIVMRQSDQSPLAGWRVRYTITGGPPAALGPSGDQSVEIETDAAGRAAVEISQPRPVPGTNTVAIEVIRPASAPGGRIVVGTGSTSKTWSAPGLSVRVSGPAVASVGAVLSYRIEVSNPGDLPLEAVAIADPLPEGLTLVSSTPPAQIAGQTLTWTLGRLAPGACHAIELHVRAQRAGSVSNCVEAAAGGLRAKDCASTTILTTPPGPPILPGTGIPPAVSPPLPLPGAAPLEVQLFGPQQATVGQTITYEIAITNRSTATASGVVVKAMFDAGLVEQNLGVSAIQRSLGADLPPGETARIGVRLRVTRAGRLCMTVEAVPATGPSARSQACVTAEAPPAGPVRPGAANLALRVVAPEVPSGVAEQNRPVRFEVVVGNQGTQAMTNVTVTCRLDPALVPNRATPDYRFDPDTNTLRWILASLAPGQRRMVEMECTATRAAARACNRVHVTTLQGDSAEDEACVEIRAPAAARPSGLSLNVVSLAAPATTGREFSYVVQVTNRWQFAEQQVTLRVRLPPELLPVRLGTTGPAGIRAHFDGQTVSFDPIATLSPGETATFRVQVQAQKPGEVQVEAQVTSRSQAQPVVERRTQTIVPQQ